MQVNSFLVLVFFLLSACGEDVLKTPIVDEKPPSQEIPLEEPIVEPAPSEPLTYCLGLCEAAALQRISPECFSEEDTFESVYQIVVESTDRIWVEAGREPTANCQGLSVVGFTMARETADCPGVRATQYFCSE